MNRYQFSKLVQEFENDVAEILGIKGESYASEDDVLHNFKDNAARLGLEPFQIWAVYFNKHVCAIFKAIKSNPKFPEDTSEGFVSRLEDAAAYIKLGHALYQEDMIKNIVQKPMIENDEQE